MNFARLADIAKALEVREEHFLTFGSTICNSTFNNHENAKYNNNKVGVSNNTYTIDKEVFDK